MSQSTATRPKKTPPKLIRTTFSTSRELDFFSEKELTAQTGHPIDEWPYVFLKETIDNALDACEEADIAPQIDVVADATGITVSDNGPGIPEATIEGALNFHFRTSNREQYVAPDRGAQGNALKTLLGMPYVIDRDHGRLIVTANGLRHEITCRADPVTQKINVKNDKSEAVGARGTSIRLEWSARKNDENDVVWPFGDECEPLCTVAKPALTRITAGRLQRECSECNMAYNRRSQFRDSAIPNQLFIPKIRLHAAYDDG